LFSHDGGEKKLAGSHEMTGRMPVQLPGRVIPAEER
jgi:hypothetical protein